MFKQLVLANLKELVRDKMALFWFLAFPLIFIVLFGFIFSGGGSYSFSIGLVVEDSGPMVQGFVEGIKSIGMFSVHEGTFEDELAALKDGDRLLVITVPKVDVASVMAGQPVEIPIHYDPSRSQSAQVVISSINQMLSDVERNLTGAPKLFETKAVKVEAQQMKDIDYLLPGILAMAIMQLGLFGALTFVTLREKKIIRRIGTTPLPRSLLLWSEILVRLLVSVVQAAIVIAVGYWAFHVTIVGNWFAVFGLVLLGALVFISLGYLLVSFSKTSESAQGIIQVVQFPMMFLSGIFFPIDFMPSFLKPIMRAMPLSYLGDALRHVMTGWPAHYGLNMDIGILAVWLVVTLILSVKLFRWD